MPKAKSAPKIAAGEELVFTRPASLADRAAAYAASRSGGWNSA